MIREQTNDDVREMACLYCHERGAYTVQPVEEVVRVGDNTAIVPVNAAVCGVCGFRVFDAINQEKLDTARNRLEDGDTLGMTPVGTVYRV